MTAVVVGMLVVAGLSVGGMVHGLLTPDAPRLLTRMEFCYVCGDDDPAGHLVPALPCCVTCLRVVLSETETVLNPSSPCPSHYAPCRKACGRWTFGTAPCWHCLKSDDSERLALDWPMGLN